MILTTLVALGAVPARPEAAPFRFAIVGLVHDHARGFIPVANSRQDIQLVAIVEPNQELAARYAKDYKLADGLFYTSLEVMLDKAKPQAQGIIQASWNWPFNRKDMEVYGRTGYVLVPEKNLLRVRSGNAGETEAPVPSLAAPNNDPLSYLAAVVRGDIRPSGLSSLEVNLIATEILDAARESARTGKRMVLPAEAGR